MNFFDDNPLTDHTTFQFQQRGKYLKKRKIKLDILWKINILKLGNQDPHSVLSTLPQEIIDHIVKYFWNNEQLLLNIEPVQKYDYLTFYDSSICELFAFRNILNANNFENWRHQSVYTRFLTEELVRSYLSDFCELPHNIVDIIIFYTYYFHFTSVKHHFPYLYLKQHVKDDVDFPNFSGININMMPIVLKKYKETIPEQYHGYLSLLEQCEIDYELWGSIGYLTISEQFVEKGKSHRRSGLHTESQGYLKHGSKFIRDRWGGFVLGGIFMASNIKNSCKIYKADIPTALIGKYGNIEYLRDHLDQNYDSFMPEKNQLVWIKDITPHESLPVQEHCYRQFFRLVCGEVSTWYENHSTKNPLGIVPPENTLIIKESKF